MEIPITFVALLAALLESGVGPVPEREALALVVRVVNAAGVDAKELSRSAETVRDVFEDAGVRAPTVSIHRPGQTLPEAPAGTRQLTIWIVRIQNPVRANERTLGLAVASRATAYVFYDRLLRAVDALPADRTVVLGRVIAHEIGHLLVPGMQHAETGIMRADVDLGVTRTNRFTRAETHLLRRALEAVAPAASLHGVR